MTLEANPANRRRVDCYELLELIGEGGMGAVYARSTPAWGGPSR